MKAKTIDRVELTRRKFRLQDNSRRNNDDGLKLCPNCGATALRLDGGCMSCLPAGGAPAVNIKENS